MRSFVCWLLALSLCAQSQLVGPSTTVGASVYAISTGSPPSVTATGTAGTNSNVANLSATLTCASGSGAVLFVSWNSNANVVTVTDSAANSGWNSYGAVFNFNTSFYMQWFYNLNLASSIASLQANFTTANVPAVIVSYCASNITGKDFTQVSSTFSSTTTQTSGSFTTGTAAQVTFIGGGYAGISCVAGTNIIADSGWTAAAVAGNTFGCGAAVYRIFSTTQTGITGGTTSDSNSSGALLAVGFQ